MGNIAGMKEDRTARKIVMANRRGKEVKLRRINK
jgi:hypothetical protein